jgi:Ser-tRNA(Ala) deacylase AlaX
MPEPGAYDAEASFIGKTVTKALKSPIFDRVMTLVIAAALGSGASMATTKATDANGAAEHNANREEVLALKAELERRTKSLSDRIVKEEAEREQRERERLAEERTQDRYAERRFARIEARLRLDPPMVLGESRSTPEAPR